jgi:RimJ/RimL family protein N-acetyltransferase
MWSDPKVVKHIGGKPFDEQQVWSKILAYAGHWSLKGYGLWVVEERATGRFLGELGFADFRRDIKPSFGKTPEAGWVFASAAHGKGYATEALGAALKWADRRFPKIVCIIDPGNAGSIRVAEKYGFKKIRLARYRGAATIVYARVRG